MYFMLDKDMIEKEIVNAIPYKLKTGVHWSLLPVGALSRKKCPDWQSVYHHFRK